jgi:hypothetical protein
MRLSIRKMVAVLLFTVCAGVGFALSTNNVNACCARCNCLCEMGQGTLVNWICYPQVCNQSPTGCDCRAPIGCE